jgi:hypothetical protein
MRTCGGYESSFSSRDLLPRASEPAPRATNVLPRTSEASPGASDALPRPLWFEFEGEPCRWSDLGGDSLARKFESLVEGSRSLVPGEAGTRPGASVIGPGIDLTRARGRVCRPRGAVCRRRERVCRPRGSVCRPRGRVCRRGTRLMAPGDEILRSGRPICAARAGWIDAGSLVDSEKNRVNAAAGPCPPQGVAGLSSGGLIHRRCFGSFVPGLATCLPGSRGSDASGSGRRATLFTCTATDGGRLRGRDDGPAIRITPPPKGWWREVAAPCLCRRRRERPHGPLRA